jgi:hypothetical protein
MSPQQKEAAALLAGKKLTKDNISSAFASAYGWPPGMSKRNVRKLAETYYGLALRCNDFCKAIEKETSK